MPVLKGQSSADERVQTGNQTDKRLPDVSCDGSTVEKRAVFIFILKDRESCAMLKNLWERIPNVVKKKCKSTESCIALLHFKCVGFRRHLSLHRNKKLKQVSYLTS